MLLKEISMRNFRQKSCASTSAQSLLFQKQQFIEIRQTKDSGPFLDFSTPFGMSKMEVNFTSPTKKLITRQVDLLFSLPG